MSRIRRNSFYPLFLSYSPETILASFLLITIVFISKQSGDDSQGRLAKISPGNSIAGFNNSFSRVASNSENKLTNGDGKTRGTRDNRFIVLTNEWKL
jgi:hypothetical protein